MKAREAYSEAERVILNGFRAHDLTSEDLQTLRGSSSFNWAQHPLETSPEAHSLIASLDGGGVKAGFDGGCQDITINGPAPCLGASVSIVPEE